MRRRLAGLWTVINWPPCDEDFDSAGSRSDVTATDICILNSCNFSDS
jgi:hypothetical protein